MSEDGKWNCSAPAHWERFRHHFLCNHVAECAGGEDEDEDEAGCPYGGCGPGLFLAAGTCYSLVTPRGRLTRWTQAEAVCRRRGGRLVSFNRPREMEAVVGALLAADVAIFFFVGLRSSDPVVATRP